jgi:hypothetical protein
MRYRPILAALCCVVLLVLLAGAVPVSTAQPPAWDGRPDQVTLRPGDAPASQSVTPGFDYASPPTEAPRPFTHLLVRREARVPAGAAVSLFVRASADGATWTNWQELGENDDLWQPSDGPDVQWSQTIDVGGTARFWQVRGFYTPAPDGARPELVSVQVNTVDAGTPPPPAPALTAIGKPAVVSRTAWGCPDGQGSRVAPDYYPVNHMVVHHTADSNTLVGNEPNWAARVRAEWAFHTYTRGWGDVGYNYLIDPNGVVYEGRAGGDDAVAFHDTGNYGSMGVVLIGTYSDVPPTDAAQDALVRLLAWKAGQKDIDPIGSSFYYGCSISKYCAPFTPGAIVPNIAGHRQVTPGHTTCPGDRAADILPSIRSRVANMLGDGASPPPPPPAGQAELLDVRLDRTAVSAGELLKVTFVVRNSGGTTLRGQDPRVPLGADGAPDPANDGYVYDQGECFIGNTSGSYPAYPKETNRVRVTLGTPDWDSSSGGSCAGATGNNPWRWGLNRDLPPGATDTVIGYVRFRVPGTYTLQANIVQEYIGYFYQNQPFRTLMVQVGPEKLAPAAAEYDALLQPLARVYRLGPIPDNFLARTANPLSIPRGEYVGSFPWEGSTIDWGDGGPFGLSDQFLIEQTRSLIAPVSGRYTFRTTSDDGSWLWVDGQPVVINNGLHPATDETGSIELSAGPHVLSFKYFERHGQAVAGYAIQPPGADDFISVPDALGGGARRLGGTYYQYPELTVAADDQGGTGVARIRWAWDGAPWQEQAGGLLRLGRLQNGTYRLRYQAIDNAGNAGPEETLAFTVNPDLQVRQVFLPVGGR